MLNGNRRYVPLVFMFGSLEIALKPVVTNTSIRVGMGEHEAGNVCPCTLLDP